MALAYVQEYTSGGSNLALVGQTVGSGIGNAELAAQGVYRTGNRPVFENFRGDIYLGGSFTRPLVRLSSNGAWLLAGIKPPSVPIAVVPGSGSGGSSGDCLAYVTLLHKEGERVMAESNPSNFVDVGTLTGEGRAWSNLHDPNAERRVTHVRGYASMNGGEYRMAWEAPYGVTAVSENVNTSRLSLLGPNDFRNNIPPTGIRYIHPWAGRMWYASSPEFPYRLWYSRPGWPQYVGKAQFRDTLGKETITGIHRARNELIVFCQDNSYMVRQFGAGQDDFVMERLDSNVGCIAHHSIKEIHNRLWFAARDGFWIYDGAFRYVLDDLRLKFEEEYCKDRQSFENGFAAYDKLNKVYLFFRVPTTGTVEWEPKTGISPGTIIYVGYIGEFEPSMNGQELQPDWSFDFRRRKDSSVLYGGSSGAGAAGNELYVASCDGKIRRQIKPCELELALAKYQDESESGDWDPTDFGADDDGDTIAKKVIIRHSHMLFNEPGDDIQSGKRIHQVWTHIESLITGWTFYGLGGDEDAWNQVRPDNTNFFWKRSWDGSDFSEARTVDGDVYVYTFCAQSVHYMEPEKLVGRGFTFEIQATSPLLMKYRGVGGMWGPGTADRQPSRVVACTYVVMAVESEAVVALDALNAGSISATDLDDGTTPAPEWVRLELLDALGATVQSDEGLWADAATIVLDFDCSNLGVNSVKVSMWDRSLVSYTDLAEEDTEGGAWYEPCAATETVTVTVTDPLGACP